MIAAVRLQGLRTPWLFGGAMDGELFLAWVPQGLGLCLQPDDVVVLDNLATPRMAGVREVIQGVGARLEYRPPYSPEFNPIELMWSNVKQGLEAGRPALAANGTGPPGRPSPPASPPTAGDSFYTPVTPHD